MESFITYTMPELKDPKNDLLADWMKKHMDKDDRLPLNTLFKAKIPFSKATASLFAFVFGNFFPKDDFAFLVDCRVMDIFIPQDLLSIAEKDIQLTDKKIYLMPDNIQYSRITYEDSKRHNGYKGQSTFFAKWINEIAYIQVNLDELSPFVRQKFIGTYHFFEICANENILNETLIELLEDMDRYQVLESLDLETSETLTQITQDKQIYIAKA
jgi:hypothetical protein